MKTYIWIVVGLVVIGLVWSGINSWAARRGVEALIENETGGNVDLQSDGTATYTSEDGTISTTNKLPDNWPADAPSYPGAAVVYSGYTNATEENGNAAASASFTTADSLDQIIAYYRQSLADNGWAIESEANLNGATVISALKEQRQYGLSISPGEEVNSITVSISSN